MMIKDIKSRILDACAEQFVPHVTEIIERAVDVCDDKEARRAVRELRSDGLIWRGPVHLGYISMLPEHVEQRRRVAQAKKREAALVVQALDVLGLWPSDPVRADFDDEDDYDDACSDVQLAHNKRIGHGNEVRLTNEEFLKLAWKAGALNELR